MRAVAEAAVTTRGKDIAEVMTHLVFLEIDGTETFDTRSVYNPTYGWVYRFIGFAVYTVKSVHLREGGGVHSFVMGVGDLTGTRHLASEKRVEQGGFADTGIAG